jgi:PEP-CTERM motif
MGKIVKIRSLILPLAACLAIVAAPAKASIVDITYQAPPSEGGAQVSFELDTASARISGPDGIVFEGVSMDINGTNVIADIGFLPKGQGGGITIDQIPVAKLSNTAGVTGGKIGEIDAGGAVLFSADEQLIDGTYALGDTGSDTFTIAAAVPEPTTWAMMLLGFAGIGFTAYRKKRTAAQCRMA